MLLDIPNFGFGPGLTVHIRTTVRYAYSFIETAAIRIGNDILQVSSFGQYMLNGISNGDLSEKLSGYTVEHSIPHKNLHQFYIDLKDGRHFTVKVLKDTVSFSFHLPGTDEEFGGTVGLLGHYHNGARLARDGVTIVEDPNDFGQEWQVRDTDPELLLPNVNPSSLPNALCQIQLNVPVVAWKLLSPWMLLPLLVNMSLISRSVTCASSMSFLRMTSR